MRDFSLFLSHSSNTSPFLSRYLDSRTIMANESYAAFQRLEWSGGRCATCIPLSLSFFSFFDIGRGLYMYIATLINSSVTVTGNLSAYVYVCKREVLLQPMRHNRCRSVRRQVHRTRRARTHIRRLLLSALAGAPEPE